MLGTRLYTRRWPARLAATLSWRIPRGPRPDASPTALLSEYRLRLAWVASNLAWITIAALVLAVFLRVGHNQLLDHFDVWSILLVAGAANLFTASRPWRRWIEESGRGWPFYVWAGLLLAFNSLVVFLARSVADEIYLIYFPVILFSVATLEPWAALAAIALAIASHGALLYGGGDIDLGELLLRSATFLAVGFMGAYVASAQRQEVTRRALQEARAREKALELAVLQKQAEGLAADLRATVDILVDGLVVMDAEHRVVLLNPAAERLLGWSTSDAAGRHCGEVLDGVNEEGHRICRDLCPISAGHPDASDTEMRLLLRRKDGSRVLCSLNTGVRRDGAGRVTGFIHTLRDITEEENHKEEILRRNRELSVLSAAGETMARSLDLDETLNDTVEKLLEMLDVEYGAVFLRDPSSQDLALRVQRALRGVFVGQDALRESEEAARRAIESGRTTVVDWARPERPGSRQAVNRWLVSVPLKSKDRTLGAMNVITRPEHDLTPQDVRLFTAVGHQMGVAVHNAVLYEEVRDKEEARGRLLAKVISAQEEERKRVARELHDDAVQSLSTVIMSLGAAEESLPASLEDVRQRVAGIRSMMVGTVGEIRKIILNLRPSTLDDLGLVPALRSYASTQLESAGVQLHWRAGGLAERLPPEMEVTLFRIVQEAVNNVARHSHARKAAITLTQDDSHVIAVVEDDGEGFDPAQLSRRSQVGEDPAQRQAGLGLLGIRERAALFGGDVVIESSPGHGTCLRVEIPLRRDGGQS